MKILLRIEHPSVKKEIVEKAKAHRLSVSRSVDETIIEKLNLCRFERKPVNRMRMRLGYPLPTRILKYSMDMRVARKRWIRRKPDPTRKSIRQIGNRLVLCI